MPQLLAAIKIPLVLHFILQEFSLILSVLHVSLGISRREIRNSL
jgi:hypothetical protein